MNENVLADSRNSECESDAPFAGTNPASKPKTVVYSCSGCSDAGELADRTARALAFANAAEMSCLAGIGGKVKSLVAKAERAEKILVIDGCALNCARHTLELAGFKDFQHLQLQRLGFRKGTCPSTLDRIAIAKQAALELIAAGEEQIAKKRPENPDCLAAAQSV